MAATLTEEKGLVRRLSGVAPCPGHYLVVFKRVKEGRKLYSWVRPGEPFKKSVFESMESFIAYAVPADDNLRHRFERSYKSHDLVHAFTLWFTLDYRVADPGTVIEKLDLDPLKRLEDEVDLLLVQKNKELDWSSVEREQIDLGDVLFHTATADRDEVASSHEKLRRFAATQGFEVKRVVVTRDLPAEEVRAYRKEVETARNLRVLTLEHEERSLAKTLKIQRDGQQNSFDRRERIADGVTNNIVRAIDQATDQIRSLDDIQRAVGKVGAIQNAMLGVAAGGPVLAVPAGAALPSAAGLTLLSAGPTGALPAAEASSPLEAVLSSVLSTLGTVACSAEDRRLLLSTVLHAIAEAVRGPEAHDETHKQYTAAIAGMSEKLVRVLRPEQVKLLRRLADTAGLQRELG
jgi:hypothetical protein